MHVTSKPKKRQRQMTMKFSLHKDKKKRSPPHIQAHLALPDTKANATKAKEPSFSKRTDRPLKIQTLYIMKFDIKTLF